MSILHFMENPMFGYFRVASRKQDFVLIFPARWHERSTFEWLRQFCFPDLQVRPTYVMAHRA
jgi:hypothetical protein